jgi:hypothetical protein
VDQRERPPDVPVRECPEPTRPGCVVGLQPGADGLDDQHVRQPGGHGLAAGAHLVDLERNEPQGVLQAFGERGDRHVDEVRQQGDQRARGRVVEADRAAHCRTCATSGCRTRSSPRSPAADTPLLITRALVSLIGGYGTPFAVNIPLNNRLGRGGEWGGFRPALGAHEPPSSRGVDGGHGPAGRGPGLRARSP